MRHIRIGIVAGEPSGDLLGADLMRLLKDRVDAEISFEGIGGPAMEALGCRSLFAMDTVTLVGLEEIFSRLRQILAVRKQLKEHFIADPPDLFIGVDLPDFNIGLEEKLKAAGIKTLHYVSPTVWAWRQYRVHKIKRAVSHMLVLFPFEVDFYREHGVPVTFAGHPIASDIADEVDVSQARRQLNLPEKGTFIALLPGSRLSEVSRLAPIMIETALWLHKRNPDTRFIAPMAHAGARQVFQGALDKSAEARELIQLFDGQSREVMAAADVVVLASGTATMEAALLKKPSVVTYQVSALSALYIGSLLKRKMVAMPNYLLGEKVIPELLQKQATAEKIGREVEAYLNQPERVRDLQQRFHAMHESLKGDGGESAVSAIKNLLDVA